jgi:hypothetical protein
MTTSRGQVESNNSLLVQNAHSSREELQSAFGQARVLGAEVGSVSPGEKEND